MRSDLEEKIKEMEMEMEMEMLSLKKKTLVVDWRVLYNYLKVVKAREISLKLCFFKTEN